MRIKHLAIMILLLIVLAGSACQWAPPQQCPRGGRAPADLMPGNSPKAVVDSSQPFLLDVGFVGELAMTFAAYVVKPLYVVGSFVAFLILWRKKSRALTLMRWGLLSFFLGENICSVNYCFAYGSSDFLEFLHGAGMIGMNILLPWGMLLLFDEKVFHYLDAERPCTFQRMCKQCWKTQDVACGFHQIAAWLALALALCALLPLCGTIRPYQAILPVFGVNVLWTNTFTILFIESRVYPILGALGFAAAFVYLRRGKAALQKALLPFFLGLGFTSYAVFKMVLTLAFFDNPAWGDWWEEFTELIAIFAVLLFLYVFRGQLEINFPFVRKPPVEVPQPHEQG